MWTLFAIISMNNKLIPAAFLWDLFLKLFMIGSPEMLFLFCTSALLDRT